MNVYLISGIKSPKRKSGVIGYVIEAALKAGPLTYTMIEMAEATRNQSELMAAVKALGHIKKGFGQAIDLYTDSEYLAAGFEQHRAEKWRKAGWKNSKGQEIANRPEWEQLLSLLNGRDVTIHLKQDHPYRM